MGIRGGHCPWDVCGGIHVKRNGWCWIYRYTEFLRFDQLTWQSSKGTAIQDQNHAPVRRSLHVEQESVKYILYQCPHKQPHAKGSHNHVQRKPLRNCSVYANRHRRPPNARNHPPFRFGSHLHGRPPLSNPSHFALR